MEESIHRIELTVSRRGLENGFRLMNFLCALFLILSAEVTFQTGSVFDGHFCIAVGILLILADFFHAAPFKYGASFIVTFTGRGFFYLLLGLKVAIHTRFYHEHGNEFFGIFLIVMGVFYMVFGRLSHTFSYPDSPDFLKNFSTPQKPSDPIDIEAQDLLAESEIAISNN